VPEAICATKKKDIHLARGRQTTLQEADGMRSSEDDLAPPEGGVGESLRASAISTTRLAWEGAYRTSEGRKKKSRGGQSRHLELIDYLYFFLNTRYRG
jgi:hypothetical protein